MSNLGHINCYRDGNSNTQQLPLHKFTPVRSLKEPELKINTRLFDDGPSVWHSELVSNSSCPLYDTWREMFTTQLGTFDGIITMCFLNGWKY